MLRTPPHSAEPADRTERLLAAVRVALVAALTALVLAIAALAYVVSFEAIRAFAIETAAFPPVLAWSAPLLVDSFTTAASLVILWRYLRGEGWRAPWYAWTLVASATAVSDPRWAAAAARTRPLRGRRQWQRPAARQPHPRPRVGRPRARHRHPPGRPRGGGRGRDQRTPRL
jgi:Protein of unknown function (DUF2637)